MCHSLIIRHRRLDLYKVHIKVIPYIIIIIIIVHLQNGFLLPPSVWFHFSFPTKQRQRQRPKKKKVTLESAHAKGQKQVFPAPDAQFGHEKEEAPGIYRRVLRIYDILDHHLQISCQQIKETRAIIWMKELKFTFQKYHTVEIPWPSTSIKNLQIESQLDNYQVKFFSFKNMFL